MKKNKKFFLFLILSASLATNGACSSDRGDYRNNANYSDYLTYTKKGGTKNYWEWVKSNSANASYYEENHSEIIATSGRIDNKGHLILNFSNGQEIDTGEIGLRRFQSFNVKFHCGNVKIPSAKVRFGELAKEPIVEGVEIAGWFQDPTFSMKWDFSSARVYGPMNIYAKFTPKKTTIHFEDGFNRLSGQAVQFSLPYSLPEPLHPKLEFTFDGWYFSDKRVETKGIWNIVADSLTLKARWKKREAISVKNKKEGADFIYFGRYPQSVVSDENLAKKIESKNQKNAAGNYEYEGHEYDRRTTSLQYPNISRNFNDGTKIVDQKKYFYRVEPIQWRLLKNNHDGTALFITENVIDCVYAIIDHYTHHDKNAYPKNMIRAWLNGRFYDTYTNDQRSNSMQGDFKFSAMEKGKMLNILDDDKFSILSKEECEKYFRDNNDRVAKATDYVKGVREVVDFGENCSWWTNSVPTGYTNTCVSTDGSFSELISNARSGIRPIIKIKVAE